MQKIDCVAKKDAWHLKISSQQTLYIYLETQTIWETNILKDLQDFGIIFLDESQTEDRVDSKSQTTRVKEDI